MHDYTVALALFDYVPILLTALAMICICHLAGDNRPLCAMGAVLIISGGLLKASWKLIVAATGDNIVWMNNALFVLMAPGFVIVSLSLLSRDNSGLIRYSGLTLATATLVAALLMHELNPAPRGWFFLLLGITTVFSTLLIATLFKSAWSIGRRGVATLFVFSFLGTLTLNGLARIPDQTATLQWIEESINTVAQGLLFIGSYSLLKFTRGEKPL